MRDLQDRLKQKRLITKSHKALKRPNQQHPTGSDSSAAHRPLLITSETDLLSVPFDYDSEVMARVHRSHDTAAIESRIADVDAKIDELRRKQRSKLMYDNDKKMIDGGYESDVGVIEAGDGGGRVKEWGKDRAEREERVRKRREREAKLAAEKLIEEMQKKERERMLQKKIKLANCEARIHQMNRKRIERDQMNRYQNKVVGELLRHPRTFYYYQASEEALEKVRHKLKDKFQSHKVKLDQQRDRLEHYERQFGDQD